MIKYEAKITFVWVQSPKGLAVRAKKCKMICQLAINYGKLIKVVRI